MELLVAFAAGLVLASIVAYIALRSVRSLSAGERERALEDAARHTRELLEAKDSAHRQAVEAIPAIGADAACAPAVARSPSGADNLSRRRPARREGVPARLKRLERYRAQGLVTEEEYAATRAKILAEI